MSQHLPEQGIIDEDKNHVVAQIVASRRQISTVFKKIIDQCYDNEFGTACLITQLRSLDHESVVISELFELSTPINPLFANKNIFTRNYKTKIQFQIAIIDNILSWLNQLDYKIVRYFEKHSIVDDSNIWHCFTSDYQTIAEICRPYHDKKSSKRSCQIENYWKKIVDYKLMETDMLLATIIASRRQINTVFKTIIDHCYDNEFGTACLITQLRSLDHESGVISELLRLSTPINPLFANKNIFTRSYKTKLKFQMAIIDNILSWLNQLDYKIIRYFEKRSIVDDSRIWHCFTRDYQTIAEICGSQHDEEWSRTVKGGTALGDLLRHLYYFAVTKPKAAEGQRPIDYDGLKASLEKIGIDEISMISNPALRKKHVFEMAKLFQDPNEDSINTLRDQFRYNQNRVLIYLLNNHPDELLAQVLTTSKTKAESLLIFIHSICTYLLADPSTHNFAVSLIECIGRKEHRSIFTASTNDTLLSVWTRLTSGKQHYNDKEDKIYRRLLSESFKNPYPHWRQNKNAPYVNSIGNYVLKASSLTAIDLADKAYQLDKTLQTIAKLTSEPKKENELYKHNLVFKSDVNYSGLLKEKGMSVRTLMLRLYVLDKYNAYKYNQRVGKKLKKGQTIDMTYISPEMYQLEELMKKLVDGKDEQGTSLNINRGIYRSIAHDMFAEILMMIEEGVNPEMIEGLLFLICAGERWNVEHKKKFVERPLLSSFFRMADSHGTNEELRYWLYTWIPTSEYHKGNTLKFILPRNFARNVPKLISHTNGFVANKSYAVINKDPAITLAASLYELTQICRDEEGNQVWCKNENTDAITSINSNSVSQLDEPQADTTMKTTTTSSARSPNNNTLTNKPNNDDCYDDDSGSIYYDNLDDGGFDVYLRSRNTEETTSSYQKPSTKKILETIGLNLTTLIAQDKELLKQIDLKATSIRIDFGEINTLMNTQPEKMTALMQASEQNVEILFNSIRYILFSNNGIKNFNLAAWEVIKKQLNQHQFLRIHFLDRIQELLTKPTGGNVELVLSLMRINGKQYDVSWVIPIEISDIFKAVLKKSDNKTESLLVLLHVSYHYFKIIFKGMVSESALATYLQSDDFSDQLKEIITADNGIFALLNELIAGSTTYNASEDKIYRSILYKLLGPVSNENIFTKIINNKIIRLIYKDSQCNSAVKNTHKIKSPDVIRSKARRLDKAYNKIATLSAQKGKENELYKYRETVCDDLNSPYQDNDFFQLIQEKGMSPRTLMLRLYFLFDKPGRRDGVDEDLLKNLLCGKDEKGNSLNINKGKHSTIPRAMFAELLAMMDEGCSLELVKDILRCICAGESWNTQHYKHYSDRPLLSSFFRIYEGDFGNRWLASTSRVFDETGFLSGVETAYHKGDQKVLILPKNSTAGKNKNTSVLPYDKAYIEQSLQKHPAITYAMSLYDYMCCTKPKEIWPKEIAPKNKEKVTKKSTDKSEITRPVSTDSTIKVRPIELRRQEWSVDIVSPKMGRVFYQSRIKRLQKTLNNIGQNKHLHEYFKLMRAVSKVLSGHAEVTPELITKINQYCPMTNGNAVADPVGFYSEEEFKTFITDLKAYLNKKSVKSTDFKKSFNHYHDKVGAKKQEINRLGAELAKAYYQLAKLVTSKEEKNKFYQVAAKMGFVPAKNKLEKKLNDKLEKLEIIVGQSRKLFYLVSLLSDESAELGNTLNSIREIFEQLLPMCFDQHSKEKLSSLNNSISNVAKISKESVDECRFKRMKIMLPHLKLLNSAIEHLFGEVCKSGDGDLCYYYAAYLSSWYFRALRSMMKVSEEQHKEFYDLCHEQYQQARRGAIHYYQQAVFMGQDQALMPLAKIYIEELSKEASDKKTKQQWIAKGNQCLEQAMDAKIGDAYLYKAKQYHHGLGEEKNLYLARFYYQQAMLLGVSAAKDELNKMGMSEKLYEINHTNNVEYLNWDAIDSISLSATMLLLHSGAKTLKAEYLKNIDLVTHENIQLRPQFRQMMRLLTRHRCQYENYQPKPDENPDNAHYFTVLPLLFADSTSFSYFLQQVEKAKDIGSDPVTRWQQAENRIIKQANEEQDVHLFESLLTYLDACSKISDDLAGDKLLQRLTHRMPHWVKYIISQLEQQGPIYTDDKWMRAVKHDTALGDLLRHLYYLAMTKPKLSKGQEAIDYDELKASLEKLGINEAAMLSVPVLRSKYLSDFSHSIQNPDEKVINRVGFRLDNKDVALVYLSKHHPDELFEQVMSASKEKEKSLLLIAYILFLYVPNIFYNYLLFKDKKFVDYFSSKRFGDFIKNSIISNKAIVVIWNNLTSGMNIPSYGETERRVYKSALGMLLRDSDCDIQKNFRKKILLQLNLCNMTCEQMANQLDETFREIAELTSQTGVENILYKKNYYILAPNVTYNSLLQEKNMSPRTLMLRIYFLIDARKDPHYFANEDYMKNLVCGKDQHGNSLNINRGNHPTIAHAMMAALIEMINAGCDPDFIKDLLDCICAGERWKSKHEKKLNKRPMLSSFFRIHTGDWALTYYESFSGVYHKGNEQAIILPSKYISDSSAIVHDLQSKNAITYAMSLYEKMITNPEEIWPKKKEKTSEKDKIIVKNSKKTSNILEQRKNDTATRDDNTTSTTSTSQQVAKSTPSINFVVESGVGQNKETKSTHSGKSSQTHTTKKENETSKETSESKPVIREVSSKMDKRYPYLYGMTKKRAEEEKTNNLTNWLCNLDGLGF